METHRGKIEDLLNYEPPFHKETWHQLKGWYNVAAGCALLPAQLTIERITEEWVALNHHIPPRGRTALYMSILPWWMTR